MPQALSLRILTPAGILVAAEGKSDSRGPGAELFALLLRRELAGRFRRTRLGWIWALAAPGLAVAAAVLVSVGILDVRWGAAGAPRAAAALSVALGALLFAFVAEALGSAPGFLLRQPGLIRRGTYPAELALAARVAAAGVRLGGGLSIWVLAALIFAPGGVPGAALTLPLVLAPLALWVMAGALALAVATPSLPDLEPATGVGLHLLQLLSPVLFPLTAAPDAVRGILALSPVAVAIEGARAVAVEGGLPALAPWALSLAGGIVALRFALARFRSGLLEVADLV